MMAILSPLAWFSIVTQVVKLSEEIRPHGRGTQ